MYWNLEDEIRGSGKETDLGRYEVPGRILSGEGPSEGLGSEVEIQRWVKGRDSGFRD